MLLRLYLYKGEITISADKKIYSVTETSKLLGIGKAKVYALIKNGFLPALNLGGLKVRKVSIEEFLAKYEGYDLSDIKNVMKLK